MVLVQYSAEPGGNWTGVDGVENINDTQGKSLIFAASEQDIDNGKFSQVGEVQWASTFKTGDVMIESRSMMFSTIDFSKELEQLREQTQGIVDQSIGFERS
jgi:hypothetical protein